MKLSVPFFGGNWKMHHGPSAAGSFFDRFLDLFDPHEDRTVVFFPPAISLAECRAAAAQRTDVDWGVQDVYWEEKGAFTGAISASMAREAGASFVLAGHSERRHVFGDSDEDVARKVLAISGADLVPVLCVGEKLEERERGAVEAVVTRQVNVGLGELSPGSISGIVVAYEPVWAIGTGRTASPADASEVHALIRSRLADLIGADAAQSVPIIYGGSVKTGNIEALLATDDVDGVLVGGASLEPSDFSTICQAGGR